VLEKYVHGIIMVGAGIAGLAGLRAAIAAAEVSNSARFSKVSIYTSCKHFNNGKHGKTIKASQNLLDQLGPPPITTS
jgi:succinate dehydrogenase/fumarate reductase flavoprotein subunit